MKEDNKHFSTTKERLRETIQELRETVSHVYYRHVFFFFFLAKIDYF